MRVVLLSAIVALGLAGQTVLPQPEPHGSVLGEFKTELALTGRVVLPNGSVPPEPVQIEYSGPASPFVFWTDAQGHFYIPLDKIEIARSSDGRPEFGRSRLTFRLPGVAEQSVALDKIRTARDLDLREIRLAPVAPGSVNMLAGTSQGAPSGARKAYQRALEEMGQNNLAKAIAAFDRAIAAYPQYATAYLWKGRALEKLGNRDAAREAYRFAAGADPAYAQPLMDLASMASQDQNSIEAAAWAGRLIRLSPHVFPQIYLIAATSYYNLDRYDDAAEAAQDGIAADRGHVFPALHRALGKTLYAMREFAAARAELLQYLEATPNTEDAADIRALVVECERRSRI